LISRIHNKLGTAGFIVAIVALVAALAGTAFAATKLNGTQKKEVEKIAKKFAGKDGAPGAAGLPGPAGAPGAKGDTGPKGDKGDTGEKGKDGKNGTNGTNGTDGEDGVCSEAKPTCVMPKGATFKGVWSFGQTSPNNPGLILSSQSFPLEYSGATAPTLRYVAAEGEFEEDCPGSSASPEAEPGFLCVYPSAFQVGGFTLNAIFSKANKFGFILFFKAKFNAEAEQFEAILAEGTWAVTAPTT